MSEEPTGPAADGRGETPTERLDRHWTELLQELRVIQTGVQLLTGFLLTLPFQQEFAGLSRGEHAVYFTTAFASIAATVFLQTPVVVARALFRRHRRDETVVLAHRLVFVGLALLAVAVVGVAALITSALAGLGVAAFAAGAVALLILALWVVLPLVARRR